MYVRRSASQRLTQDSPLSVHTPRSYGRSLSFFPDPAEVRKQADPHRTKHGDERGHQIVHAGLLEGVGAEPPHRKARGIRHVILSKSLQSRSPKLEYPSIDREKTQQIACLLYTSPSPRDS